MDQMVIAGRIGRKNELRYTQSGSAAFSFSVAVDRSYTPRDGGERVKRTVWYRVNTWNRRAEVCHEYLQVGQHVTVVGQLEAAFYDNGAANGPKTWEDRDGNTRASFEVRASNVEFGPKSGGNGGNGGGGSQAPQEQEEIPF